MNILHISDIHFRREYSRKSNAYERMLGKMENPLKILEFCLEKAIHENTVDLLAITGDLTDNGTAEDYRLLRKKIESITTGKIPIVITPGNHDHKENFRTGWLGTKGSWEPYGISYETEDLAILSFDSSEHGNPCGRIADSHLQWLEEKLEDKKDRPVLLMTHHHFSERQADIPCLDCKKEFWDLLHRYPVIGILNGHTHHHARGMIQDIPYYTADSLSFCGENLMDGTVRFEETYGYSLYTVEKGILIQEKTETISTGKIIDICKGSDL